MYSYRQQHQESRERINIDKISGIPFGMQPYRPSGIGSHESDHKTHDRGAPFLHHLPPPFPSSPRPYSSPRDGASPSRTDPQSWAQKLTGGASRQRWSPPNFPGASPRGGDRLPPLADFPHRSATAAIWEGTSAPTSYPIYNSRYNDPYRPGPPILTPITGNDDDHSPTSSQPTATEHHPPPDGEQPQKKKKRRVALSCAECAKRKQKCNRETPCQHCVARRVPELCVPFKREGTPPPRQSKAASTSATAPPSPGRNTSREGSKVDIPDKASMTRVPAIQPTISVRVGKIEKMLNAVLNRVDVESTALSEWRSSFGPASSPPPVTMATMKSHSSMGSTQTPRPTSGSVENENENENDSEDRWNDLDKRSSTRNPLPQSPSEAVSLSVDYHGTPAEQLERLFRDCGVSSSQVQLLMRDLPERSSAESMVGWYFDKVNYVRYPLEESLFRRSFEDLYNSAPNISAPSVLALPLVFMVLAIAIRIAPESWFSSPDERRKSSLKMYWNSKTAIVIASAVKSENLQLVETRILSGLYLILMHDRRLAEGWAEFRAGLTTGQAIGLHRDGSKMKLPPYVTEYRRRLWSYLCHADATYSCLLGRPTSIDPTCVDTLPPSNLDLQDLYANPDMKPKPISEPTSATYLILRKGLADIVRKMTHHFQRLNTQTQYRDVEALDAEFKQFVKNLPDQFKMLDPDKSYDKRVKWLPVHRYYICTEILHFTIILHRPWLLRRLRTNRYALSRTACFESAVTDFKIRQAFKIDCPDFFETLLGSSFREFNAAMIAGISILVDPRGQYASDMRDVIRSFMDQHPHDPDMDDFSVKEVGIIYTLHRRIQEMDSKRSRHRTSIPDASRPTIQDNTSFERMSPRSTAPVTQPTMAPPTSTNSNSINRIQNPGGSVNSSPLSGTGLRTPSMLNPSYAGVSPEEDHPQRLLDHWISHNNNFGPGADSTLNPTTYSHFYLPEIDPSNQISNQFMYQTISQTQYLPNTQVSAPIMSHSGVYMDGANGGAGGGVGGWNDPSLAMTGPMLGLGMAINNLPHVMGEGGGISSLGLSGGVDGNNPDFWNILVDGIVSGTPYELSVGGTTPQ